MELGELIVYAGEIIILGGGLFACLTAFKHVIFGE